MSWEKLPDFFMYVKYLLSEHIKKVEGIDIDVLTSIESSVHLLINSEKAEKVQKQSNVTRVGNNRALDC